VPLETIEARLDIDDEDTGAAGASEADSPDPAAGSSP